MSVLESTELNIQVFNNIQITSLENMIIKSLGKFYDNDNNIKLFISIINSESKISIRLIDHFVTKYSKYNKINYKLKENNIEQTFNVYTSYKQQLKAFQKKHFDPFSRGDRIPYFMNDSCIITTIGQLNFFRWFISKKIYEYILTNREIIECDMNKKNKKINVPKMKKISKSSVIYTSSKLALSNNCKLLSNTLDLHNNKSDKIIVSFTFN
jgi:hypothetical protein